MKRVCETFFFNAKRLSEKLLACFCLIVSFAGCFGNEFEEFINGDYETSFLESDPVAVNALQEDICA